MNSYDGRVRTDVGAHSDNHKLLIFYLIYSLTRWFYTGSGDIGKLVSDAYLKSQLYPGSPREKGTDFAKDA